MSVSSDIKDESAAYICIDVIANIFSTLVDFILVILITINKEKYLYIFTVMKLGLCILVDLFLVSNLSCSLNFGVNGIGFSKIIVNVVLFIGCLANLEYKGVSLFYTCKDEMTFGWMSSFAKKV
jgi:Na+-driven multidrug efflux pump